MTDCKTCSKCGEVKAVAEFSLRRANCKKCAAASQRAYYKANPEKTAASAAAWRKANPEKTAASAAAWRKANPEKLSTYKSVHYKAHPERFTAKNKAVVSEMRTAYIASVIGVPVAHLSPELLALKRRQLETHRLSKQIAKAIKAKGKPV